MVNVGVVVLLWMVDMFGLVDVFVGFGMCNFVDEGF